LKIWFGLTFSLFCYSIFHSFVENLKLLFNCHYLSFSFIFWSLVTKFFSWLLNNIFLCI
jgi:hypothetical protein